MYSIVMYNEKEEMKQSGKGHTIEFPVLVLSGALQCFRVCKMKAWHFRISHAAVVYEKAKFEKCSGPEDIHTITNH